MGPGEKRAPDVITAALNVLSYRDRSAHELSEKLKRKGYADSDIQRAVDYVKDAGYLDDERYARGLAQSRVRNKRWGPVRITADLRARGVAEGTARRVVDVLSAEGFEDTATEALRRWVRKKNAAVPLGKVDYARAYRHLSSLGHSSAVIRSAIEKLASEEGL